MRWNDWAEPGDVLDENQDSETSPAPAEMINTLSNEHDIKEVLQTLWAELLHDDVDSFTDEDVWFDVGGDSVLSQKLITAAKKRGIYLTMQQVFQNASLLAMARIASVKAPLKKDVAAFALLGADRTDVLQQIATACNVSVDEIEDAYPCSPMQESLVVGDETSYMRQLVFKLSTSISIPAFREAWSKTILANAALRTRVCYTTQGYVQAVLRSPPEMTIISENLNEFLRADAQQPRTGTTDFVRLSVVEDSQTYFVWTIHHALCDGASIAEILHDVARNHSGMPALQRVRFRDFIETNILDREQAKERHFWQRTLSDLSPMPYPSLPVGNESRKLRPSLMIEHELDLGEAAPSGCTKSLLLRATWTLLIHHYTGCEDVAFGAINDGRESSMFDAARVTGPTINLTPITMRIDPKSSIKTFLGRVVGQAAAMKPFEHTGISTIRRYVSQSDSSALDFQSLMVVHGAEWTETSASDLQALGLEYIDAPGKKEHHPYPLVLTITLASHKARLRLEYSPDVVSQAQAQNMAHHFQRVLTQLSCSPRDALLETISPLSDRDLKQILEWNASTPQTEETCIDWLFTQSAIKTPDAIAVCSVDRSLTYQEVQRHVSVIAAQLIRLEVRPGDFVGVCFEKSIWTVVGILAVFMAGGVYVPIDPSHPAARISEAVNTADIQIGLASSANKHLLEALGVWTITLDDDAVPNTTESFPSRSTPAGNAYLLYTSGSTGKPKGILMSHRAICTSILHHGPAFGAGPHWRTLQFGAHTFDLSIGEFFTTLAFGGCICVPSEEGRLNDLAGSIRTLNVNTLLVVPTVAKLLIPAEVPSLKTIVLAGEPITKEIILRWADHVDLTCAYGPSETAVWCSGNLEVKANANPAHIGMSIGGTMWIANPHDIEQLTAIGCVGEIVISGAILGNGYLGNQRATDAAFVPAPKWLPDGSGQLVYKSGDLARYNPDGSFHIVGRADTQVKLRGYRIELGEIENQITTHGVAKTAVAVLPQQGPCSKQIVAVVSFKTAGLQNLNAGEIVMSDERDPRLETAKRHLSLALPEYMVPTVWIILDQMPLLSSGKIDRKLIKTWIGDLSAEDYQRLVQTSDDSEDAEILPGTTADTMGNIWAQVLNVPADAIKPKTSFFAIGGDSIAAIQIVAQARSVGLAMTVKQIIAAKTIERLAAVVEHNRSDAARPRVEEHQLARIVELPKHLEEQLKNRLQEYPNAQIEDVYSLTPFQKLVAAARAKDSSVFVFSWALEISSTLGRPIDLRKLAEAWRSIVDKFAVLRTVFLQDSSSDLQVVLAGVDPTIACSSGKVAEEEPLAFAQTGLPSVDDCLLLHRAHFLEHGERVMAYFEFDHRLFDGWSLGPIKAALLSAYKSGCSTTTSPEPSFRDFVSQRTPERMDKTEEHWKRAFEQHKGTMLLGAKPSESEVDNRSPSKHIINLAPLLAAELQAFSSQHGVTFASIFDAAWAQTLSSLTQSNDVVFEYVVSGRDEDISGIFEMVGPLINVLPYHLTDVTHDGGPEDLAALAKRMQEQRTEDASHALADIREITASSGPLSNTGTNFQRRSIGLTTGDLRLEEVREKIKDPWHFDVLVRILYDPEEGLLRPSLEFNARMFDQRTMESIVRDFEGRVRGLIRA